jgi:crotonobetainyl-CoA:carnitine CoA-transferase CaiB-like acyl-CoA transferase
LLRARTKADWLVALEAAKVPCGPINDLGEVFADPQVQAREMTTTLPHPLAGEVRLVASPIKLSATPAQAQRPPPLLGQHTDEILAAFGLDESERQRLHASGALGTPGTPGTSAA